MTPLLTVEFPPKAAHFALGTSTPGERILNLLPPLQHWISLKGSTSAADLSKVTGALLSPTSDYEGGAIPDTPSAAQDH